MGELNFLEESFPYLYIIVPIIYLALNFAAFKDRKMKDVTILSSLGYGISSLMINLYYICIVFSAHWLNVDAYYSSKPTVGFLLSCIVLIFYAILSAGSFSFNIYVAHHDNNETSEVWMYHFLFPLYIIFYTFVIWLVFGTFAPFMLYNIYMSPTICFLLGNVYIIPIVWSAVGDFALNDLLEVLFGMGIT